MKTDLEKFMKEKYPELVDFDNLQFVKDCKEEGIKEHEQKVKEVIGNRIKKCEDYIKLREKDNDEYKWKAIASARRVMEELILLKKELGLV